MARIPSRTGFIVCFVRGRTPVDRGLARKVSPAHLVEYHEHEFVPIQYWERCHYTILRARERKVEDTPMNRLADKRCLIVGGTTGLGLAAAARFLDEGARLVIVGRSSDKGSEAAKSLAAQGSVSFKACDAADVDQVEQLFAETIGILGGLDVLYHVAGISGRRHGDGPLHECTDTGWQATLDANLKSTFLTNRAAVRHFLGQRQPGVILNMASVLGFSPSPHYFDTYAYAATKGGIIAMSRLAAARYARDRIRINVIAPGLIDTPMARRAASDPAIVDFLRTKQPLAGGPGRPEDCSDAAVFLCSEESAFITGVVLPVDGGWCVSEGQYGENSDEMIS
jgi:NAD(P)-dependent dehydrogenase (short-subunit alcohol dehydrogenase family)